MQFYAIQSIVNLSLILLVCIIFGKVIRFMFLINTKVFYFLPSKYFLLYWLVWRIFTAPFIENGFISSLITTYFISQYFSDYEQKHGTIKLGFFILQIHTIVSFMYLYLIFTLSYFPLIHFTSLMEFGYHGILPIIMTMYTLTCMKTPNETTKICLINKDIKYKYLPILYCVLIFISGMNFFSFFIALIVGFICKYFFLLDPLDWLDFLVFLWFFLENKWHKVEQIWISPKTGLDCQYSLLY